VSRYQRPDHYTRKARAEGLPARSAYKLEELDDHHHLARRGGRYLDLGCRPGSWSAWIRRQAGVDARLLGVDIEECDGYPGTFLRMSVDELTAEQVELALGGAADVVLSDMAPNTSGARDLDHLRQIALAEAALAVAERVLAPGGAFVCKVFDGRDAPAFVQAVRLRFTSVRRHKPKAVRSNSREFFLVGLGFRGAPPAEPPAG
jgi:23S rRNA (uridine2552-2'-O)-methyltransferase